MKVLHVLEAVGGGTMRHLADLVAATPIDHHVACPAHRSTDLSHPDPRGYLEAMGATVHTVSMSRKVHDRANLVAVRELAALINEVEPDVIHAHASVAGALARVAARHGVPVIWTPHAVHGRRWVQLVERLLRRRAKIVVALSPSEAVAALDAGVAKSDQIRVIPNGVAAWSKVTTSGREELGIPEGVPVIGFIGRLCEQKAPLDFIYMARGVLQHVPEAHVVCVGSGPLEAAVLDAAQSLPSGRFHHVVRDSEARELLNAMDVLVTPSRYEGGPYLPLEAMLAGVPVVATDCAGLKDYVVNGVSGVTVPVGDIGAMVEATRRLLVLAEERGRLVHGARLHVELHHHLDLMASRYEDLYLELAPAASLVELPREVHTATRHRGPAETGALPAHDQEPAALPTQRSLATGQEPDSAERRAAS